MILEVVQSKWSLTWYDPLGPRMCVLELMNGHVLQTLQEQLKVPGSRLEGRLAHAEKQFFSKLVFEYFRGSFFLVRSKKNKVRFFDIEG